MGIVLLHSWHSGLWWSVLGLFVFLAGQKAAGCRDWTQSYCWRQKQKIMSYCQGLALSVTLHPAKGKAPSLKLTKCFSLQIVMFTILRSRIIWATLLCFAALWIIITALVATAIYCVSDTMLLVTSQLSFNLLAATICYIVVGGIVQCSHWQKVQKR